jgi:hypothetical protein
MHLRSPEQIRRPGRALWLRWAFACTFLLVLTGRAPRASGELFQFTTQLIAPNPGATNFLQNTVTATVTLSGVPSDGTLENLDPTGVGTDIVFGKITVTGLTHNFTPGAVAVSIPYEFDVTINDYGANFTPVGPVNSATVAITGTVIGTIGPGNQVNINQNIYDQPFVNVTVGATDFYTIHLSDAQAGSTFVHPGLGNNSFGSFGAHVTESTRGIPEPGTLTLFGLGILSLALPAYRRWRHKPRCSG